MSFCLWNHRGVWRILRASQKSSDIVYDSNHLEIVRNNLENKITDEEFKFFTFDRLPARQPSRILSKNIKVRSQRRLGGLLEFRNSFGKSDSQIRMKFGRIRDYVTKDPNLSDPASSGLYVKMISGCY
uniref:Uncharacterized protein n=1 Tax=Caenorhabditis tropicalis TaxID=1561998 RepID=A0A1I7U595_9PELO